MMMMMMMKMKTRIYEMIMTTTASAFSRVAQVLTGIDAADHAAVELFYRRRFTAYPPEARALISDFLIGLPDPSDEDLAKLKQAVEMPVAEMPLVTAPAWDERYGPPLEYSAADPAAEPTGTDERSAIPPGSPPRTAAMPQSPAARTAPPA